MEDLLTISNIFSTEQNIEDTEDSHSAINSENKSEDLSQEPEQNNNQCQDNIEENNNTSQDNIEEELSMAELELLKKLEEANRFVDAFYYNL